MFELALPWVLLLLPLPLVLWFFVPRAKRLLPEALRVPFFHKISELAAQEETPLLWQANLLIPAIIWLLFVLALAGPRWLGEPRPLTREGYQLMLALDLSDSMRINDMLLNGEPVSRLTIVKRAATQFVKDRVGDRIGLILFGTRAYLQTPLTYDHANVLMRIEDATPGLAGVTTSIGDAIGLAIKRLEKIPQSERILILLTDGANNSGVLAPLKAAELAKEDGIKIYTIGLGSEGGVAFDQDVFVSNATTDLDEETLKKIANLTGGRYFRASDLESLHSIYQTINQLEKSSQEQALIRPQKEYYPWLLALALVLYFYWLIQGAHLIRRAER